ncbi:TPA: hypothetical protein ACG3NF_001768 [Legionella pneumophila]|uniref:Uncharacterized protein n=1 Tax=Legionella pneumophila TaxID=446 RepID=A0AAP3HEB0_LEGPN|nr:hypothetical protein [Legionella pneumophila]AOW57835.1 hypothetical protein BE843_05950 [Legionella pneumophila subsp. pneumophila]AOW61981.1 hypothetical protein BE844_12820 [Legionella pneumophila subsp. pneumophila]AOW67379.1 hypothetical protein BE846_10585 [Legionella pneumophila subsp. pneumophila]MCZ4690927.1 hypothetical protein [Legionella pneumophila]MCZ4710434.1 hypothetical protein [Legionella pneumophila]
MNNQIKYTQEQLENALFNEENSIISKTIKNLPGKLDNLLGKLEKFELNFNSRFRLLHWLILGLYGIITVIVIVKSIGII